MSFWRTDLYYEIVNRSRRKRWAVDSDAHKRFGTNSQLEEVVQELRNQGIVKLSLFDLPDFDETLDATALVSSYEKLLVRPPKIGESKLFIERLIQDSLMDVSDPLWSKLTSLRSLEYVAGSYMGLEPELSSFKVWRSVYTGDMTRQASQMFHRDFNDRSVLRAFLYFGPVKHESGATQFVLGSHRSGPLANQFADRDEDNSAYANDDDVESNLSDYIVTADGDVGDMYIIDTSGLHRGGFHMVESERRVALFTYSTNADLMPSFAAQLRDTTGI